MNGHHAGQSRQRIGPWRLLDIVTATMSMRAGGLASGAIMPEYGPPDVVGPVEMPVVELPDSNLHPNEQQQAVRREAARRFARERAG
jgi:hypothetical protein